MLKSKHEIARAPIMEVLRSHWRRVLMGCSIKFGPDAVGALMFVFTLTYLTQVVMVDRSLALSAVSIGSAANLVTIPLFGSLSDRFGRRRVYLVGIAFAMTYTWLRSGCWIPLYQPSSFSQWSLVSSSTP